MNRFTVCVIAQNEQKDLPRLLKSVEGIADEIIVVDGGSTDRTAEIARDLGAKVFARAFTNFAEQKNFAASMASNDWIFMVDADEELSEELKQSVIRWKAGEPEFPVYEMSRLTWYLGAWIHHSRWYPDWQRRIYRRDRATFSGTVHEALRFEGRAGRLRGDLLHYTMRSFAEHEEKLERYTTALAQEMFSQGKRSWRWAMWLATPWSWVRHFLLGAGFLDGYRGALIAQMAARGVRLKFKKLGALVEAERHAKSQGAA
jgi:glycosyltransferase involved in cell wall biosynthesis